MIHYKKPTHANAISKSVLQINKQAAELNVKHTKQSLENHIRQGTVFTTRGGAPRCRGSGRGCGIYNNAGPSNAQSHYNRNFSQNSYQFPLNKGPGPS